jgi:hypothetical protein
VHCIPNALELTLLRREDVWRWPMRIQSAREKAVRSATGHPNAGETSRLGVSRQAVIGDRSAGRSPAHLRQDYGGSAVALAEAETRLSGAVASTQAR